ncbi:amino acid transport protein [Geothermobacter hydrogeniphilus]|uniref:Amino acid transport protein n=1 Tax=Geothermobacter hydrogeniphilus TaxID=1969733 RepID=A0A2K2H9B4_9BACT|nr:amino acid transport protein [Geothermobacter hydrogeniphilus]PNU19915.1 amino acid transport protein [Geothermobacter hydrogeniphilus]
MDSSLKIFLDLFVGSLGFAYFIYGKKQRVLIPTLCGVGLMAYPYFVQRMLIYIPAALLLALLPFLIRE